MPHWMTCAACDGKGDELCLRCLGVGEEPDEDGVACIDCIGEGIDECDSCDGIGGWYNE
jgi:hypothetical protein